MPQRVVHVNRTALEENNRAGVWTKPTLIVALHGVSRPTSLYAHAVEVVGVTRFLEHPPGVHAFVDDAAVVTAYGPEGKVLDLPPWAKPSAEPWAGSLPDVALAASKSLRWAISSLTRQRDELVRAGSAEAVRAFDATIRELSKHRVRLAVSAGGSAEDTKPGTGEYPALGDDG